MVNLVLEQASGEVQQLHVRINEFLLCLIADNDLPRSRDKQFYSWISAAFLPFLYCFLRVIDYAWIQEGVIRSMSQLCILVPFVRQQELLL